MSTVYFADMRAGQKENLFDKISKLRNKKQNRPHPERMRPVLFLGISENNP